MELKVKSIQAPSKPNRLAEATVEVSDGLFEVLTISDIRILQNKEGQLWVAMPSRSVSMGGRSYTYLPQVEASKPLQQKVTEAVLQAFEQWYEAQSQRGVR